MQETLSNTIILNGFSKEMLLLIELSQNQNYFNSQNIAKIIEDEIDWTVFSRLVDRHRMIPIIFNSITQYQSLIPNNEYVLLQNKFKENQKKMMLLAGELNVICNLFAKNNILVLTLKGTPLAIDIYHNVAMRSSRDIDILVREEDIDCSVLLLENIGYKLVVPNFKLTEHQANIYKKTLHHFTFKKPNGAMVELHWRLFTPFSFFPQNTHQLFQNASFVNHFNYPILTLDKEINLLYLMVHGSVHQWYQLYWIKDLSEFLYCHCDLDKSEILKKAKELDILQSVQLAFHITNLFYNNTIPDISEQSKKNKLLCEKSIKNIKNPIKKVLSRKIDRISRLMYLISLQNNFISKWNILANSMANYRDWENFKLPDSLFLLYYPLRPFLWVYSAYIKQEKK